MSATGDEDNFEDPSMSATEPTGTDGNSDEDGNQSGHVSALADTGAEEEQQQDEDAYSHIKSLSKLFDITVDKNDPRGRTRTADCKGCWKHWKAYKIPLLLNHLKSCTSSPQEFIMEFEEEYNAYKEKRSTAARERNKTEDQKFKAECDILLVDMIACDMLPMSCVESSRFQRFVDKLSRGKYKLPSRHRETDVLMPMRAAKFNSESEERLNHAPKHSLTVEFDGWKRSQIINVLGITITDASGRSTLIDLVDVADEPHDSDRIVEHVKNSIHAYGIGRDKIGSIISDDAANCTLARRKFVQDMNHVLPLRCTAHLFNLVAKRASRAAHILPVIGGLLNLTNVFTRSRAILSFLKTRGASKLIRAVPTRWHTTYYAINSFLRIRELVDTMPRTREFSPESWADIITDEFWSDLSSLEPYYRSISDLVRYAEGSSATLSEVTRKSLELLRKLVITLPDDNFRDFFTDALCYQLSLTDFPLLLTAYFLDPKYRCEWLGRGAKSTVEKRCLAILIAEGRIQEGVRGLPALKCLKNEFKQYQQNLTYLEPGCRTDFATFWKSQQSVYLKSVARRISYLHPSSANTERFFSTMNQSLSPDRNRIHRGTLFNLMCIRTHVMSTELARKRSQRASSLEESEYSAESSIASVEEDSEAECVSNTSVVSDTVHYNMIMSLVDFNFTMPSGSSPVSEDTRGTMDSQAAAQEMIDMCASDEMDE